MTSNGYTVSYAIINSRGVCTGACTGLTISMWLSISGIGMNIYAYHAEYAYPPKGPLGLHGQVRVERSKREVMRSPACVLFVQGGCQSPAGARSRPADQRLAASCEFTLEPRDMDIYASNEEITLEYTGVYDLHFHSPPASFAMPTGSTSRRRAALVRQKTQTTLMQ